MDYTFHLSMPIYRFKPSIIRDTSKLGIRQITLEINNIRHFQGYDWEAIFTLARKYGVIVNLYPHTSFAESKNGKKLVAEIKNYWYYLNHKHGQNSMFTDADLYSSHRYINDDDYSATLINNLTITPAKNAGIYPQ